jgi:hypothetical protein
VRNLWTFETANFVVSLDCCAEWAPDFSWMEEDDLARIESGEWECVSFRVTVADRRGIVIGCDWLGNSIYADVADFRREHIGARGKWGSYFRDMVHEAVSQARSEVERIASLPLRRAA